MTDLPYAYDYKRKAENSKNSHISYIIYYTTLYKGNSPLETERPPFIVATDAKNE